MQRDPGMLTTSTNRNLLQPTKDHERRRRSEIREGIRKGKNRSTSPSEDSSEPGVIESKMQRNQERSPSASRRADRSQLVDLVVEDTQAEEAEMVRARKEGSDKWNRGPQRQFVRTYGIDEEATEGDTIREGYDPSKRPAKPPPPERAVSDDDGRREDDSDGDQSSSQNGTQTGTQQEQGQYASVAEESNVWK